MAIFDAWQAAKSGTSKSAHKNDGTGLIAAAGQAFEGYINQMNAQHQSMIQGLATYALSPNGKGAVGISVKDIAPFLALNIMA